MFSRFFVEIVYLQIGQGRFGKVYTAVNNSTGELMAMKEITIQPGETRAIKKVAEELKILEGINHKHLVKYYGIEIHRVCSKGASLNILCLFYFSFLFYTGRTAHIHGTMLRRYT